MLMVALAMLGIGLGAAAPAQAQTPAKTPHILFIMGDDIGISIGQSLWLQELEPYGPYPALQSPASYSWAQVLTQVKEQRARTGSSD